MSEELNPCPFCGSDDVSGDGAGPFDKPESCVTWVVCNNCGGSGMIGKDYAECVKHWNTRHIPEGYALVPVEAAQKQED